MLYYPITYSCLCSCSCPCSCPILSATAAWHADKASGDVARVETGGEDNFSQCGNFFRNVLGRSNPNCNLTFDERNNTAVTQLVITSCLHHRDHPSLLFLFMYVGPAERERLTDNIAGALVDAQEFLQKVNLPSFLPLSLLPIFICSLTL